MRYRIGEGTKEVRIDSLSEDLFDEILGTLMLGMRENRGAFRTTELMIYGVALSEAKFAPEEEMPAQEKEGEVTGGS